MKAQCRQLPSHFPPFQKLWKRKQLLEECANEKVATSQRDDRREEKSYGEVSLGASSPLDPSIHSIGNFHSPYISNHSQKLAEAHNEGLNNE